MGIVGEIPRRDEIGGGRFLTRGQPFERCSGERSPEYPGGVNLAIVVTVDLPPLVSIATVVGSYDEIALDLTEGTDGVHPLCNDVATLLVTAGHLDKLLKVDLSRAGVVRR